MRTIFFLHCPWIDERLTNELATVPTNMHSVLSVTFRFNFNTATHLANVVQNSSTHGKSKTCITIGG